MALKDSEKRTSDDGAAAAQQAKEAKAKLAAGDVVIEPRDIPEIVSGLRIRQLTPFGNMHVKITVDPRNGRELEVFAQLGKGGDLANSDLEAICRMISLWLRSGGSLNHVIRQLKDIGSSLQVPTKEGKIKSLGDGLARALMKYRRAKEKFGLRDLLLGDYDLTTLDKIDAPPGSNGKTNGNGNGNGNGHGRAAEVRHGTAAHGTAIEGSAPIAGAGLSHMPRMESTRIEFKVKCPSCGEGLVFSEGCNKCYNCGWAQC
jgi:ribonucleoside-diphosphate reductase alpha chain